MAILSQAEDQYNVLQPTYRSLSPGEIIPLKMPPSEALAEAELLTLQAQKDRDALLARGCPADPIDGLDTLTGGFAFAQAHYEAHIQVDDGFKKSWKENVDAAYSLRKTLMKEMAFAYRHNAEATKSLEAIQQGRGHYDMILDLLSLSILGRLNPAELEAIRFDPALLDQAKQMHDRLSQALAGARIKGKGADEALDMRECAWTRLKQAIDLVREYGQFVFANNPPHAELYTSNYYRSLGKAGSKTRMQRAAQSAATPSHSATVKDS